LKNATVTTSVRQTLSVKSGRYGDNFQPSVSVFSEVKLYNCIEQELSYRKQIACQLRTRYVGLKY